MPERRWTEGPMGLSFSSDGVKYVLVAKMPEQAAEIFAKELNKLSLFPEQEARLCGAIQKGDLNGHAATAGGISMFILEVLGESAAAEMPEPETDAVGLVQYPLEPPPGNDLPGLPFAGGRKITDYPWSSNMILPALSIGKVWQEDIDKMKPAKAGTDLRTHLDDLSNLCLRYDQARQKGVKALDPNYPPDRDGHKNLLMSIELMRNQIAHSKRVAMAMIERYPFLAGDLQPTDRDLLTVPDTEDQVEEPFAEDPPVRATMTVRAADGRQSRALDPDDPKDMEEAAMMLAESMLSRAAGNDRAREMLGEPSEAIPAEINVKVPMSGAALNVILKAAAAKPKKDDPARPIHSVGIGQRSICATDQYKIIIVGEPEEGYASTDRKRALVQASECDIMGEFVRWDEIERMKPEKEGDPPPPFPEVSKIVADVNQMVDVGCYSPSLLKQVAQVAEALGAHEVRLFRSKTEQALLAFEGTYCPQEQLDLFKDVVMDVPFKGLLSGKRDRTKEAEDGDDE